MEKALLRRLRETAPSALADLPVRFAYLFGSRATGRPCADSVRTRRHVIRRVASMLRSRPDDLDAFRRAVARAAAD